jgi:hypothetical protein
VARARLALLLLCATVPCAQAHDPLAALDACIARLDASVDVGYARIAARCPELTPALTQSPFAPWLPADWNRPDNQLSAAGLSELHTLLVHAAGGAPAARRLPATTRVAAVLAALPRTDSGGGSWWLRFKDWLHRSLTPRPRGEDSWLQGLLARLDLSTHTWQLMAWVTLAVAVVLAAGIVINELRAAGLLGRRAARVRAPQMSGAADAATLEQIDRAAPQQQPGLLLELIAARLAELGRLPPARALTARELGQRAHLPDESARTHLAELVSVCERVRFSAERVAVPRLTQALHSGRLLLAVLDAPLPGATPAAVS